MLVLASMYFSNCCQEIVGSKALSFFLFAVSRLPCIFFYMLKMYIRRHLKTGTHDYSKSLRLSFGKNLPQNAASSELYGMC